MKVCSKCAKTLPVEDFHLKGGGYRRPECRACFKASRPRHARTDDLTIRARNKASYQRYYKYGVTEERYQEMLSVQSGCCAICQANEPGAPDWQIDHDHRSGEVRGLLCRSCNIALGLMGDDSVRLARAISYLSKERANV